MNIVKFRNVELKKDKKYAKKNNEAMYSFVNEKFIIKLCTEKLPNAPKPKFKISNP